MAAHYMSLRATQKQRVTDISLGADALVQNRSHVPLGISEMSVAFTGADMSQPHFASHHLAECFTRLEAPCLHGTVWYTEAEGLTPGLTLSPLRCVTLSKSLKVLVFSSIK